MVAGEYTDYIDPPAAVLPEADAQRDAMAALLDTPGIDMYASIGERSTGDWPRDGYHIWGSIRPGFSGLVDVTPYRQARFEHGSDPEVELGKLTLIGTGMFAMAYENPQFVIDRSQGDLCPDCAARGLDNRDDYEVIELENRGRLLMTAFWTKAGDAGNRIEHIKPPDPGGISEHGFVVVQKLALEAEVRSIVGAMGVSMGLTGNDLETFTDQPFRKISPTPAAAEPGSGVLGSLLNKWRRLSEIMR